MKIEFPYPKTTEDFFNNKTGRYVLLNVLAESLKNSPCETSVVVNKKTQQSAGWRPKEENKSFANGLTFQFTKKTICMTYDDVNALADNFRAIHDALPKDAFGPSGRFALGTIPRDGEKMGRVLSALESHDRTIVEILKALEMDLNTDSLALRKKKERASLMANDQLSPYGADVLKAFADAQLIYASLPELTGFGTSNPGRSKERPEGGGALLRYYMQHNPTNPLNGTIPLNFVDYELKPLNISDTLNWNCKSNPRTDSIDLLLSFENAATLTEVKMAGDSFVSTAVVQLLYYASTMANKCQHHRLLREFPSLGEALPWLCVVAEERNEADPKERGFGQDMDTTIRFLKHNGTAQVLRNNFQGLLVIIIRKENTPYDEKRGIPAFRVTKEFKINYCT